MPQKEHVYDARAMMREAVVVNVNDSGGVQTVDVITQDAAVYSAVPVLQPWGLAGSPPKRGLRAILLSIGGDPANMRAILYSVGRRMGGLANGETGIYGNNGARVAIRQGGTIQVLAGSVVEISAPNVTIVATGTISLAGAVQVTGNLTVTGNITNTGTIHTAGGLH